MIKYIKHNLRNTIEGIIPHGVNCQSTMGSGVAKDLFTKWPKVRESYMKVSPQHLGMTDWVLVSELLKPTIYVVNCWTQQFYGKDGKVYGDVNAIRRTLIEVFYHANLMELPIYMPRIGCGLAGLHWENDVKPIIEVVNENYLIDVFVCYK
jgi:O-acetyl-ADP-ribose deacetylase (regulator of RNase III)